MLKYIVCVAAAPILFSTPALAANPHAGGCNRPTELQLPIDPPHLLAMPARRADAPSIQLAMPGRAMPAHSRGIQRIPKASRSTT